MQKILLTSILFLSMIGSAIAADIDPITQTKALLDQYSARVRSLEAENAILREEMRKAGIKIPLSAYSGVVQTNTVPVVGDTPIATGSTSVTTTGTTAPVMTTSGEINFSEIEKVHGPTYTGFIKRIISEWDKVRDAYLMPKDAHIGGYEFVVQGNLDHVYIDIIYTGSTGSGIYDAKLLYQFDKTTFARKLIGFFEYNPATGYYITKTGKNTFSGVKRTFVQDPRIITLVPGVVPSVTSTGGIVPITNTSSVSYADIEAAYTAKRFLSVITLSNTWLASNAPNLEVLRIRYRTYFIIAKYTEALKEIEKIRAIGQLSSAVACEGYVIATYAKDTALTESYKTTCNKK